MNKRVISFGIIVVLILGAALYLLVNKGDIEEQDATPRISSSTNEEDIKAFNQAFNEMQTRREEVANNKTPEKEAEGKSFLNKLAAMSKAAIKDIKFYGKIVDQNGDPVSGVIVEHAGLNATYASGSGTRRDTTDNDGLFVVDASGTAFVVEKFTKQGYDFPPRQRFVNELGQNKTELLWGDYTADNPFIFKAWKVAESGYAKISHAQGRYGFKPGAAYSLDFTANHKSRVKKEGRLDLDLQVLFEKDTDENWTLVIKVPNGGLLEAEELYMNLAPEAGYQQELFFSGTRQEYEQKRQMVRATKKYYIHSRGRLYGSLEIGIRPYSKPSGSGLKIKHVMNLDGGRNLEVK